MAFRIYNTLTRKTEEFVPIEDGRVRMYVCGPTVYGHAHLGHGKSYVSFDVLLRYLRYLGYAVTYVQNITDVGHLTDDADQGEDKLAKQAQKEHRHPMAIAEYYTRSYFEDMDALQCLRPDICPRATGHIPEQIELTQTLIDKGFAYAVNGSVYFDVTKFAGYGKLSGRKLDDMQAGARVEVNSEKRNAADFALWKKAEPNHIMQWLSPWGRGYPAWHLECSAMSMKYLGQTIDIHGGGIENQFPHHECEIAQSEAATGKPFAKYWLHNNMLTIDGTKMGKSLGNFITIKDMLKKVSPQTLRLFILTSHYRSVTDFSDDALGAAEKGMARLTGAVQALEQRMSLAPDGPADPAAKREVAAIRERFGAAMDDDFNTAEAIAELFNLVRQANSLLTSDPPPTRATLALLREAVKDLAQDILGLWFATDASGAESQLDEVMRVLIDLRQRLRAEKHYALADEIRSRLSAIGIQLKDEKERTTWARLIE